MLTSRITAPPPEKPEAEDIFSSSLNALFTDDTNTSHGIPGGTIIYTSPRFGPLTLRIPAHPGEEEGRRLFAHYLWTAAIVAADLIETGSTVEDTGPFHVRGRSVLELGAGTALPSLSCALSGAARVTVTDHPDSPSITTGAIVSNVQNNLKPEGKEARSKAEMQVAGYVWGESTMYSTSSFGMPLPSVPNGNYDRVLICDCLWMPSQHRNLVASAVKWLSDAPDSYAIVISGFHTGRVIVGNFFDIAAGEDVDGRGGSGPLSMSDIYEIDVDGQKREWLKERAGETKEQLKRWCVVGILTRR